MTLSYTMALVVFLFFSNKTSDGYLKNKGEKINTQMKIAMTRATVLIFV